MRPRLDDGAATHPPPRSHHCPTIPLHPRRGDVLSVRGGRIRCSPYRAVSASPHPRRRGATQTRSRSTRACTARRRRTTSRRDARAMVEGTAGSRWTSAGTASSWPSGMPTGRRRVAGAGRRHRRRSPPSCPATPGARRRPGVALGPTARLAAAVGSLAWPSSSSSIGARNATAAAMGIPTATGTPPSTTSAVSCAPWAPHG